MANKMMGVPNLDWTREEWLAIFNNLVDIFYEELNGHHTQLPGLYGYYCKTVAEAVIVGCNYDFSGTELTYDDNGKLLIHVW